MAHIAADGAGIGANGDCLQAHAGKGLEIAGIHVVVRALGAVLVEIEGVIVLHQEFAAPHHAETRAHFVAEFPLDLIKVLRQIPITFDEAAEDIGDDFFVGRAVEHLPLMTVDDAQHLLAVIVVAPAFFPEIGRLDRRHEQFLGAGRVLLFAHDLLDPAQHAKSDRQPVIDARTRLPDHPGTQHQAMRSDLRIGRSFFRGGKKIDGTAHDTR